MRRISMVCSSVLLALTSLVPASAQTTGLIGGGLTALPTISLGPDQLKNGGFEAMSGGFPTSWTAGTGWAVDQLVHHSGSFSYRATGAFSTSSQPVALKKGIYKLSGWIRTQGVGSGTANGIRLQFDRRPTVNDWKTTDVIFGTRDWTLFELPNLVLTDDATVTIKLENYNNSTGTVWFDDVTLQEQQAKAVEVFMLYPNFRGMLFDDQSQTMKFDVTVTPPSADVGRYSVRGILKDEASGQTLLSQDYAAAANFVADLDGGLMQPGRAYLVTFSLVDKSNDSIVSSYPAYRVSKAPGSARAAMNVSFDAKNRVLVRGVPRFVLGVYDSGSSYSTNDAFWENQLWSPTGDRRMNGMNINFYLNYWFGQAPPDAMKSLMGNLQKHGVMYLQTGNCFDKFPAGTDFLINGSDAYVQDIGAHPASGGYYTIDECLSSLIPGAFAQYDRLRRLDPDSITFMANFGRPDLVLWRDSADILATDPYPLYGAQPSGGYDHGEVGRWTAMTRDAVKDSRPIMTVLQFFKFTSQGRFPTTQEMRNHAWMAIVEGARGLWWWSLGDNALKVVCSDWCAEKTGYMNNLKTVVNEVAALEPVLVADDAPGALRGNSNTTAIHTKVKLLNGHGYLLAYNTSNATASGTFTWNTAPGTVTVYAENRTLSASGSTFTDSFGPFQAHVYVLDNAGSGGTGGPPPDNGQSPGSPTVTFVNPAVGATVSGTVTVTLSAAGGSGNGYTYSLALNGTNLYTGSNGTFSWNTTNAANGSQMLTAGVTDSAGGNARATRNVTVSNTAAPNPPPPTTPPPSTGLTVALTQPANNSIISGTNWPAVWVNGAAAGSKLFTLSVNGQTVATANTQSSGPVMMPWNTQTMANGTRTLTVTVRDAAGKTGSKSITVTIQNTTSSSPPPPPASAGPLKVAITQPAAPGSIVHGTAWVVLWVEGTSGNANTFTLTMDGVTIGMETTGARGPVTIPWTTTLITNGTHTLTATVRDATGKTGSTNLSVVVKN